ncbi:hypothetical protein C2845_PM04G31860 [Panicum miliaceum]|uniref:Uncharacterized protein n=1 Tax=Panicum miliaceum TaxID=4540 RepID=A0A3L6QSA9_PANMI|nr:hypothetical protein C2845_PM04G31860 [Panicum miliaceum]
MSIRSLSSLGRLALQGISRARTKTAAAVAPNSSVDVLFPAALGSGAGKGPHALALTSSTFGGGSQGSSVPGVPFFTMTTFATFSTRYMMSGEASAKGKPTKDAEEASAKGKPKGRGKGFATFSCNPLKKSQLWCKT